MTPLSATLCSPRGQLAFVTTQRHCSTTGDIPCAALVFLCLARPLAGSRCRPRPSPAVV